MNWIERYCQEIETGSIVTSARVKKVYARLLDEIKNQKGEWVFRQKEAQRPIDFIEKFCRQSKGSQWFGRPVMLELFQKAYISALFGFVHKKTGIRRFKETLFLVARKNGKSTMLSGIALYMLVADGEGGAEVYSVATKKDQARIVFTEAVNMVRQSPDLSKLLKKRKTDLYLPLTFSKFEPLASDSNSLDGLNSYCVIIDELHAIKDRNLYEVMKQSMSARQQPMLIMITTSGTVRECIYDDMYEYACKVADGSLEDERFLPVLYELDRREEWTDWRMWPKANPGLGTIKKLDDLAEKVERAKNNPNDLPGVLTKDFNIRETVSGAWLTFEEANNEETFDIEILRDSYGVGGVDLGATTDLTAACILVMKPGSNKKNLVIQGFMPADTVEQRSVEDKVPYNRWVERGLITICPGNRVDYRYVTDWFIKMREQYGIVAYWCYYDSWNSPAWVEDIENRMGYTKKRGENNGNLIPCIMGAKTLSAPMKELKADLAANQINYNNNPVVKWCLTNVAVEIDKNENIRPIKGKNQRQRIDLAVALLIAYTGLYENLMDYKALIGW